MTMFQKYGKCRGMTIFRYKQYNAEIWYAPVGTVIPAHKHPLEQIELMYLFGSGWFSRIMNGTIESAKAKWPFSCFTVPKGVVHWFLVGNWPLIFINFSRWTDGHKPTSASVDIEMI